MSAVNVHEIKAHFSEYLAAAERGETVVIARRNKPIAKLVPIGPEESEKTLRPIGLARGLIEIDPTCFDPMTEEELAEWYDIKPSDPLHPEYFKYLEAVRRAEAAGKVAEPKPNEDKNP
jgi:prevent-host-death family protein